MSFDREALAKAVGALAEKKIYIGTSSWKYPGWCGMLYESARYEYRGKLAMTRFERNCLEEYAKVFKTVSVDAGEINQDFLNADLFTEAFLKTCEPYRSKVGLLMFEFGRFYKTDFSVAQFSQALDTFFGKLPKDWPYGIEIRNRDFLGPEYFGVLAKHGVAHVYNSWTDMPAVGEQMAMSGSVTNPNLVAARFLMSPGRKYDESLKLFQPYDRIREPDKDAREAGAALIVGGERYEPRRKTFVYVNNRLEGNALETIAAMVAQAVTLLLESRGVVQPQSRTDIPG